MSGAAGKSGGGWTAGSIYGLAVLTLIYTLNYADRQILGLVLPLLKKDMHLSDTSLGLITGFVFVLFYSLLGVPIARLADRSNRRNILAVGLAFWSLLTALTGIVVSVWQLVLTRFLMGAGEATGVAPSTSLVSDMFDKARRPLAMAILTSGSSLASLLFFPIVGWIAQSYGWRACFLAAGVLGLAVSLLLSTTVREPARQGVPASGVRQESVTETARFLFRSRAYVFTVLGGAFSGVSVYASQVWHPSFLARIHHLNLLQIGSAVGLGRGIAGLAGTLIGGLLAERLGRRDPRWRLMVAGLGCALAFPSELVFLLSPSLPVALVGMFGYHLFANMQFGPIYAACQSIARPSMRATATAVFLLSANLMGQIIGPFAVGFLNDRWAALYGQEAIRYSLVVGGVCTLVAGILILVGSGSIGKDTARAEASS